MCSQLQDNPIVLPNSQLLLVLPSVPTWSCNLDLINFYSSDLSTYLPFCDSCNLMPHFNKEGGTLIFELLPGSQQDKVGNAKVALSVLHSCQCSCSSPPV